jgi:hypothetical protein
MNIRPAGRQTAAAGAGEEEDEKQQGSKAK